MMPVTSEFEEEFPEAQIDYKQKYKALKKKLRLLVYEQECFLEELRKAQRKLLKVSRDRSFLLDRLLQQEKMEASSEESDATNSTDTDEGGHREPGPAKKRKLAGQGALTADLAHLLQSSAKSAGASTGESHGSKKKSKAGVKKSSKSNAQKASSVPQESPGHMTREELERHLESKQHEFIIEKATASLPMEIFSNDPNHDSDGLAEPTGEEEEDDLVIDVPH